MPWAPSTLRGRRLIWLLDLRIGERTVYAATEPCEVPQQDGSTVHYLGGLQWADALSDSLDLFSDSHAVRQASFDVGLDGGLDIAAYHGDGHRLGTARGRLWAWPDGGAWDDAILYIDGIVDEPEYGAPTESISLTLVEDAPEAAGLIPQATALATTDTWDGLIADGNADMVGEFYPIVIGRPGAGTEEGTACIVVGTDSSISGPALAQGLLLAGHEVAASSVTIYDEDDDASASIAVRHVADGLGRMVATATVYGSALVWDAKHKYYARWPGSGGLIDRGAEMRGAGQVLRWLLLRSGTRVDGGRLAAALPSLDGYLVAASIVAKPDERVRPLDWVRDHLLPILPVSLRRGPDGLYPVVWRWESQASDCVARLDADAGRAVREGPVVWSSVRACASTITLRWMRNWRTEKPTRTTTLTGDPARAADDADAVTHGGLRWSWLAGIRAEKEVQSDVVADETTAHRVLGWLAARYGLPSRSVSYIVDTAEGGYIEPGQSVLVVDAEVGLSSAVGLVESVVWRDGGILITARIMERPGGRV